MSNKADKRKKHSNRSIEARRLRRKGWKADPNNIGAGPRKKHHDMIPPKGTKEFRKWMS